MKTKPKLIVVLGPTASGKSDLAVELALKYNGEVVSADSRQVYTGLNIGTGKITKKEMQGVPHHLLDVATPKKQFSVALFKKQTDTAIAEIVARGKLPILCGGTGFYIQSIVDNILLPEVPANPALRKILEPKSTEEVFEMLKKTDSERAKDIDQHNKVRLIRALEIAMVLGKVPPIVHDPLYDCLQIGITTDEKKLKDRIYKRLIARIKKGMMSEAKKLHTAGLSWKRMNELGLEYRYLALLLQKKITKKEFIEKLNTEIWHYAKRQMTWFKKDIRIKWFTLKEKTKVFKEVKSFIA